jgi:LysM repeat protein
MKRFDLSSYSGVLLLAWVLLCVVVIFGLGVFYIFFLASRAPASQAALPSTAILLETTPAPPASAADAVLSEQASPELPTSTLPLTPTPEPTTEQTFYVVQEGDYLGNIAAQFGVSIESIQQANNLQSDVIHPGQNLLIPPPPSPNSTPTPNTSSGERVHTVLAYESLERIANWYNLPIEEIRIANAMVGDAIFPGQFLIIPTNTPLQPTPWQFSQLDTAAYPISFPTDRFTLHYTSGAYAANNPEILAALEQNSIEHIERIYDAPLEGAFDIYLAGSLYAPPNRGLRGKSVSAQWVNFLLFDGSGNAAEQQYMAAHELTHLYAWQVFGVPVSTMLSEGAAVYAAAELVANTNRLPPPLFCAAHLQANVLPNVSGSLGFEGHIFDLVNYYSAGCFVGYLVETYGPEKFAQLYPTNDFSGTYGKTARSLEEDWRAHLAALPLDGLDAGQLVAITSEVSSAYRQFLPVFTGAPAQIEAYRLLDQARIAMLENRLSDARLKLDAYQTAILAEN